MNSIKRAYLLLKELGPFQLVPFALYRIQLKSGKLQQQHSLPCPDLSDPCTALSQAFLFKPPAIADEKVKKEILSSAAEIVAGLYHPFSGDAARLDLSLPVTPLQHWTFYCDQINGLDIKTIWEPARFSWVIPLCQAYTIQPDDELARTFWQHFEVFVETNPEFQGPNWISAQEVALRLVPWLMAAQTFQNSPESTPERLQLLLRAIWQAASRISVTLNYSRSQNNNHLLSETLGLILCGLVFITTANGKTWQKQGFSVFQKGILDQVESDGTYSQHSTNYHRLMLHLALLFTRISALAGLSPSKAVKQRLAAATRWLIAQFDVTSGRVPNLGHNDGSNLLSIGCEDYADYRPTVQAASRAFLGARCLFAGSWDQLSEWLGLIGSDEKHLSIDQIASPAVNRIGNTTTWATLRSVQFHSRPAHADLLHVDIWHNGNNILTDAGTYAYNLPQPWENSLSGTSVHNTITVNEQDQMVRAGKFLWLQRARVLTLPLSSNSVSAILYCDLSDAYTQVRTLTFLPEQGFVILDQIELSRRGKTILPISIQFLLPDWQWHFADNILQLSHLHERASLRVFGVNPKDRSAVIGSPSLIRAGEKLLGTDENPIRGWVSPTYLVKIPALSFTMTFETNKTLEIKTELNL